jgi:hypothetical protein
LNITAIIEAVKDAWLIIFKNKEGQLKPYDPNNNLTPPPPPPPPKKKYNKYLTPT